MPEYFSHDYEAREDEKIIDMLSDIGYEGYGIYWAIIEMLYKNKGVMQTQYKRIAFALKADHELVEKVIKAYSLFKHNRTHFWSESVKARLKIRREKSAKARESAYNRWNKSDANAMQTHSKRNAKLQKIDAINKERNKNKKSSSIERIFKEDYNDPKYVQRPK
jgi:hypothetical protein